MQRRNVVLTFLSLFQVIFQVASRELHVTHNGRDNSSCGQYIQPCQTVHYAVRLSHTGDTILVENTKGWPYHECGEKGAILIQHSLTIQGINGSAEIQCRENRTLFLIRGCSEISLTFGNLILSNSGVAVNNSQQTDIKLVFNECTFRDNSIGILIKQSANCSLVLNNASFHNHQFAGIESLPCQRSIFNIKNSLFYSSSILQREQKDTITEKYELFINNCSFLGGNAARRRFQNGIFVHSFAESTKIIINKTIFKNHVGLNYNEYLLWIKAEKYVKYNVSGRQKTTFITLDRLTFEDNYWKKTLIYLEAARAREYWVLLENSLFQNNTGTIEFAISPFKSNKYVLNRYFHNNTIVLRNNTFLRNRYFPCQGWSGIYATLFFNLGSFQAVSCKFIDNLIGKSASTGVISISDRANVTLRDCYFELGKFGGTAIQVFAYPKSLLKILGNNTFNIIKLNDGKTIFIHLPSNKLPIFRSRRCGSVLMAGILNFICPQGFNISQYQIRKSGHGQNETIAFTYLNVLCSPCPRKTYSLDRGVVTNIPTFAHNTSGTILRDNARKFECHECPRGGDCVLGYLKAKPNFWGYRIGNKVRFIDCPHDYCCDSYKCPTYNVCDGKRTGTLCGRCPSDTSESLFSTACRQNNTCNASIFFPAAAFLILAFIIFFLYNEDIVSFLQRGFSVKLPSLSDREDTGESGGIKILFYYYQTINLLISSVGLEEKNKIVQRVNDLISNIFNLIVADISSFDCPLPSITPVSKTLMSHSFGFVLLLTLGVGCLLWKLCSRVHGRKRVRVGASSLNPLVENNWDIGNFSVNNRRFDSYEANERNYAEDSRKISFTERALGAFTHISLLMYSTTARLCLTLLHCVPYKNTKVLFIDGTMQCYQSFQYALLGYVIMSVLPFCMVPFLGSYVLNLGLISVTQFCLGCLLPFPFCCYWLRLLFRNRADVNGDHRPGQNAIHKNRLAILHVLSGPFRTHGAVACFPRSHLAWEGVLILRRLVLILIFAFTYDRRWRPLCALTACVLILVIHLCVKPFRKRWENCLETASLTTLVIFCGFTLVKALYRGEDYSSLYTKSTFMPSINMIESVLIILPLAAIVVVAFILLITRLIIFLGRCFV